MSKLPTYDEIDWLVESDTLALRDLAFRLLDEVKQLRAERRDLEPGFDEVWAGDMPPKGSVYRVLKDEWTGLDTERPTRTILAWVPATVPVPTVPSTP